MTHQTLSGKVQVSLVTPCHGFGYTTYDDLIMIALFVVYMYMYIRKRHILTLRFIQKKKTNIQYASNNRRVRCLFSFYKVDLLDIYHITRVLKANAFTGDSWLLELRLDYSLDNELWMVYQRNKQLLTNEVQNDASVVNGAVLHFAKIVYMIVHV